MEHPPEKWHELDDARMHIIVEGVFITRLDFTLHPENRENLKYELNAKCRSYYPEPDKLVQELNFKVTHEVDNPALDLEFTIVSNFRSEGDGEPSLKEFARANAPAYVVPYARELIANITSRTGILPTLVIPPVNIFSLIEKGLHDTDELTLEFEEESNPESSDE